ncbi:YceI family protein [Constantimarinum furrinae]|uniref:YCE I like family protein n=1 Tax=Constantimarinum furrinae TaxID=2562285 RepID=A0A7G8PR00_9FLAO|nr:YceI family protein [Constantimarinum furrinae]QNJ96766.1 YCE I like family protein [Constantimarinum furrinae]
MKRSFLTLALIAFVFAGFTSCKEKNSDTLGEAEEVVEASDAAVTYTVNTEKSVINWKGEKPTATHTGTIKLSSGELSAVNRDIEAGKFTIDMNSITDTDLEGKAKANLEAHLKGTVEGKEGDFFNVPKYPESTFELTGVSGENGKITVSGNLTIKDQTHNIEFPATVSFPGDEIFLKSAPFTIDRTKWGVNFGSKSIFDNLGDKFINDEVELVVELHASKME